ncbi:MULTISPECIES: hypothetical protein [Pseudomonas]|uniref:Uncharacterized protein n=1 Tax=Pseudomonas rubra TaxID=2942627 RepID=A0ABT5PGF3_9PSED|nr:hypothetical protein [Pseudomonas rubra]MDD1017029.1 hypothetical protein [Pseudomonas rubra]MDD1041020.1 hypothetical protein [Pseudomonas rubra]MDD1157573.1 hypothetical protein [Pseudomonas rubra]
MPVNEMIRIMSLGAVYGGACMPLYEATASAQAMRGSLPMNCRYPVKDGFEAFLDGHRGVSRVVQAVIYAARQQRLLSIFGAKYQAHDRRCHLAEAAWKTRISESCKPVF